MVGWYDMGLTKQRSWYEDGKWYRCTPEKAFDPFAIRINPEYITTIPEFRYTIEQIPIAASCVAFAIVAINDLSLLLRVERPTSAECEV